MATQTIKKQKAAQEKAVEVSISTHAKAVSQGSYTKPFVMPDLFLNQADDMGKFLDKNPLPKRD